MKIWLNDTSEYIDISFWSILKVHISASIVIALIFYLILALIMNIFVAI